MEGLAVDAYGNVYVSGTASYPPEYAFLSKFDSAGDLDWSKVWNYANMSTGASSTATAAERLRRLGWLCKSLQHLPGKWRGFIFLY
jgi:hypothetical protein